MTAAMRVLIGCEESGIVRRAFAALGHDAWSCDLLPAADGSNRHLLGDVRDYLHLGWDLLAVFHPPCTRLCNSGVRWLTGKDGAPPKTLPKKAPSEATVAEKAAWAEMSFDDRLAIMWRLLREGADMFSAVWNAPIERVAVENPVMHKHAKRLISNYHAPAQTVQPWWFGDPAFKATSFYLRGLAPLRATNRLTPPRKQDQPEEHAAWSMIHRASPGKDRARLRSRTFPGIAAAAAMQWGGPAGQQVAA